MKFSSTQIVILAALATLCFLVWKGPGAIKRVQKVDKKVVRADVIRRDSFVTRIQKRDTVVVPGRTDTSAAEWLTVEVTSSGGGKLKVPAIVEEEGTWGDTEKKIVLMSMTDDKFWKDK